MTPPQSKHLQHLVRLLDLERQADQERALSSLRQLSPQAAQRTGFTLLGLQLVDQDAALGGRFCLTFALPFRAPLPWTRLESGSPVCISDMQGAPETLARGVIQDTTPAGLTIALDDIPEELSNASLVRVDLAADETSYRRQRSTLDLLQNQAKGRTALLRDVILGERRPSSEGKLKTPAVWRHNLNEPQRRAVEHCLAAEDISLIHGPPGTGKTTVVTEILWQAIRRGQRVLVCAASNLAVDNVVERLMAIGEEPLRLGHPARATSLARARVLDVLLHEHHDCVLARNLVKQAWALFRQAARETRARFPAEERRALRDQAKGMLRDARRMERAALQHLLTSARIVCATLTGLDEDFLAEQHFDLAVVDEASQATEPATLRPILFADKLLLAGDHLQLPPTVISQQAADAGLANSLFQRLAQQLPASMLHRLEIQYRMHQTIMEFSSAQFYEGSQIADASVAAHLLKDLPHVLDEGDCEVPLVFVDTAGADWWDEPEPEGSSRQNPGEARLAVFLARRFLSQGVQPQQIGLITPYSAQARLLRELLSGTGVEVDTVDGFQGREKEAVLLSLVRSNPERELGFLRDTRRLNVALTRARRHLTVVGDSSTLAQHSVYAAFLQYAELHGRYRSVWEETDFPWP